MSWEEYNALPPHFAWKQEYLEGVAYIRPREICMVCVAPPSDVPEATPLAGYAAAPLHEADEGELARAYKAAFRDTPDLCDYVGAIMDRAARDWARKEVQQVRAASLVIRSLRHPGAVAAIAVIRRSPNAVRLDTLLVRPAHQRRGLGTFLLRRAASLLRQEGVTELFSMYHPLNEPSAAWHARQGFVTLPSLQITRLRLRAAREEWRQWENNRVSAPEPPENLWERITSLERETARLETLQKIEGYEAVEPIMRL